jgi:hypothetical protein
MVFKFDYHARDKNLASGVFHPGGRDSATMFFHAGHRVSGEVLAPYRWVRELTSA